MTDHTSSHSDTPQTPKHVAVIMDGNGRWATQRGLPRLQGHNAGADAVEKICRAAADRGIKVVSVFAFAQKNWKRDLREVSGLMFLLSAFIKAKKPVFLREGIRVKFVGNRTDGKLSDRLVRQMEGLEAATADLSKFTLFIAINYDGDDELQRAAETMAGCGEQTELRDCLDTAGYPDPEIVIRTGLKKDEPWRDSGFYPMQTMHATKIASECLWPDANESLLHRALDVWGQQTHLDGGQRQDAIAAE